MSCDDDQYWHQLGIDTGHERMATYALIAAIKHVCDILDLYPELFGHGDGCGGWVAETFYAVLADRGYDMADDPYESARRPIPKAVREQVLNAYNNRCYACKSSTNLQIDHIVPLARGGDNDFFNLQVLCKPCNLSKGTKDMDEWMASR